MQITGWSLNEEPEGVKVVFIGEGGEEVTASFQRDDEDPSPESYLAKARAVLV